ncbi:MAG: DnaJ domain-containing protein [Acidobacteria bacterium]|nr:DnaJ domain-containing protein [Acidobacteriota bacterium]
MSGGRAERDHYETLGAGRGEARAEIERRYKRLARQHHPDRGGDEEEMKAVNEAWRVLGDAEARREYDARHPRYEHAPYVTHRPVSSPGAQADPLSGRIVGALLCTFAGLVLLFLVKAHYIMFLWPLALLGLGVVLFGVLMAHGALVFAREQVRPGHPARRFVWAQEAFFWACVVSGGYGVYLLLRAV